MGKLTFLIVKQGLTLWLKLLGPSCLCPQMLGFQAHSTTPDLRIAF